MAWIRILVGFFKYFITEEEMSIPRKADGTLDEKAISKLYIVYSTDGSPIFVVAITVHGPETEPAATPLINEIKNNSGIPYEESSLEEYVYYYHIQENLQELRKKMKLKR